MQAEALSNLQQDRDAIPKDPRARRVLRRLAGPRSWRERWSGPASRLEGSELNRLYWLVRWIGPRLIHLEGCPDPRAGLMLAAAAADGGCRRIRCPLLLEASDPVAASAWSTLQEAGLDWLLRSAAVASAATDLLVLASSLQEQIKGLQALALNSRSSETVLGLVQGPPASRCQVEQLQVQLRGLGLQLLLPSTPNRPFWLAVNAIAASRFHRT
ncbi:hypothetical protein AY599_21240 [Leptolyngbya valderiana BDU 20041]|nr:hypothetical protein AY599_21240 [Leptolyngbya valderiana BDU 20041]